MANLWVTDMNKADAKAETAQPHWFLNTDPKPMEFPAHWGVPPDMQTTDYLQAPRLLETTPRVRIFNNRNNSLDSNSSNYSNNCNKVCPSSVCV